MMGECIHSTLAEVVFKPAIRKLLVSKEEGKHLLAISHMVHWEDLILILIAGFG
jgi:hypothetical protein